MPELIFAATRHDYSNRQKEYRGPDRLEYYEGDNQILPGPNVNVRIERGLSCAYSVLNLRSSSPIRFRRSMHHIRQDRTDVCIVWFVKHGSIVLSRLNGKVTVRSGECTITRSLQPFVMDCLTSEQSLHEVLHIVAPTHVLRPYIPDDIEAGTVFSSHARGFHVAERTFDLLYAEGESICREAAEGLAHAAMRAFGSAVAESINYAPCRSLADKRFQNVTSFIQRNLSNQNLTVGTTARACGISERYLSFLLKKHGATFSDMLWESRIRRARACLTDGNMQHVSIRKIAYMTGFKSPAHFSRMFKSITGIAPQIFRELNSASPVIST